MGWRLSPMFDVNPNPHGGDSALDMGDILRIPNSIASQKRKRSPFLTIW